MATLNSSSADKLLALFVIIARLTRNFLARWSWTHLISFSSNSLSFNGRPAPCSRLLGVIEVFSFLKSKNCFWKVKNLSKIYFCVNSSVFCLFHSRIRFRETPNVCAAFELSCFSAYSTASSLNFRSYALRFEGVGACSFSESLDISLQIHAVKL